MGMGCTSLRCCLNGLVLCNGRVFFVYCVRSEADYCVVAIVLMCLPVAQVRSAGSEHLAVFGCMDVERNGCQQYF